MRKKRRKMTAWSGRGAEGLSSHRPKSQTCQNCGEGKKEGDSYGLLYRRWLPPGRNGKEMAVEQLVLPKSCRETVMRVAHCIPLAGHQGKDKTARRVLQRFYWPTIYRDVAKFCRSCGSCQKVAGKRTLQAPLIPLPIITEPFARIAMDHCQGAAETVMCW